MCRSQCFCAIAPKTDAASIHALGPSGAIVPASSLSANPPGPRSRGIPPQARWMTGGVWLAATRFFSLGRLGGPRRPTAYRRVHRCDATRGPQRDRPDQVDADAHVTAIDRPVVDGLRHQHDQTDIDLEYPRAMPPSTSGPPQLHDRVRSRRECPSSSALQAGPSFLGQH